MADDRNSGMNVPILFRHAIAKKNILSDWTWLGTSNVKDYHIGVRETFDELPVEITLDLTDTDIWFQDGENADIWYCTIPRGMNISSASRDGFSTTLSEVAWADLDATDEYFWDKDSGIYVYNSGSAPSDVEIKVPGDYLKEIYALTDFGVHSEELLNSPNMEINSGYYAFIEQISLHDDAVFRTAAATSDIGLIRYMMGQTGFFNSFFRYRDARPEKFLVYQDNFFRKYVEPIVHPALSQDFVASAHDILGGIGSGMDYDPNVNITCNSKVEDLESVKYGNLADIAFEVWDARNRAFAFGINFQKEFVGAVSGTFMSDCNYWAVCLMKIAGKVTDWQYAYYTNDAGVGVTGITSDMNLKNNVDIDFDDATNDWVELGCAFKPIALTIKMSAYTGTRQYDIEYLNDSDVWTNITHWYDNSSEDHVSYYNTTDSFQKKTVGDFYRLAFYEPAASTYSWTKRTLHGFSAYWIRVRPLSPTAGDKFAWASCSGIVMFDPTYAGTLIRDLAPNAWSTDSVGYVPLSVKYISEKMQFWGCIVDIETKKYFPFCIKMDREQIESSAARSWEVSEIRFFNDENKYNFGKKFYSFAYESNTNILGLVVDDQNKNGKSELINFKADFKGSTVAEKSSSGYIISKYKGRLFYQGDDDDSVVLWDGENEIDLDLSSISPAGGISCSETYNDELYIGFYGDNRLVKFDGKSFSVVDTLTGVANILALKVYGNNLYIGTDMSSGDGQVWMYNGSSASSIRTLTGSNYVSNMIVFDSKLFICCEDELIENYDGTAWTTERSAQGGSDVITCLFNINGVLHATNLVSGANNDEIWQRASNGTWSLNSSGYDFQPNGGGYNSVYVEGNMAYIAGQDSGSAALLKFDGNILTVAYTYSYTGYLYSIEKFGDTLYCWLYRSSPSTLHFIVAYDETDFDIEREMIGGEGNATVPMKTIYSQIAFPESTSVDLIKRCAVCGCSAPDKNIVWEYSNYNNLYINVHSIVNDNLREIIKNIVQANDSIFYTDCDGRLIFKNKNLKGASDYIYTMSNRAGYGEGVIKSINNIELYENIINKVKIAWNSNLFGSGVKETGTGFGIGKQLSISNNIIDDEFKALALSNNIFSNYSLIREVIKLESILLYFLEMSDIVKIQVEHPRVYINPAKEWLLAEYDFDINSFLASFKFIERVLE